MEIKITGLIPFINILFHKIALIACEMIITHLMKTVSLLQVLFLFFFKVTAIGVYLPARYDKMKGKNIILFCLSTNHLQYPPGPLVVHGPQFGNDWQIMAISF